MSKKILLIDDDPVATTLLETRLKKSGYDVSVANAGKVGINMAKKWLPEVIVLDVEMPDINGYDVLNELRNDETTKEIRVIVQTSHEENKPIFSRKGVKDYLVKPVNPEEIITLIRDGE